MRRYKDKIKILFIYSSFSSFVKNDLEILQKHFDVTPIQYHRKRDDLIKVAMATLKHDITFCWFAADHAAYGVFFSKIFGKKSIVIVGGWDVAYVPEIDHGRFTLSWNKRTLTKFALRHADKILVVDPSLKDDAIKNAKVNGKNIDYLPTGYDPKYWEPKGEKENIVLTVGALNKPVVKRKGFKTFIKAAGYIHNAKFVLIGKHIDDSIKCLREMAPSNVEFTGFVSDKKLLEWYQKAKIYCQLSRYEGLPNTLCEGMLCECIPIGTKFCGIPRAIGDTGFYVDYGSAIETAEAIKKALQTSEDLGKKARKRIKEMFPHSKRERNLIKIIEGLK